MDVAVEMDSKRCYVDAVDGADRQSDRRRFCSNIDVFH